MNNTLASERWRYMVLTGLWPKKANFDPAAWMSNFTPDEEPLAQRLLEGFTFFTEDLVKQMFRSAFLNLSTLVVSDKSGYTDAQKQWACFVDSILVVRVTGETPNDTDSGFTFARFARDILMIPEANIVSPAGALEKFLLEGYKGNILFVDDFVGSGNQFCETWFRSYHTKVGLASLNQLSEALGCNVGFFYCPVICTELGRATIQRNCGNRVKIVPAHFFGTQQSTLSMDSSIWREDMRTEGPDFIREASNRAGIPDLNGNVGCYQGFNKLGLALAFSHGYPDATIPLFYHNADGWIPLIRKGTL